MPAMVQVLLGGVPYNFTTKLPTFHGCIRGVKVGPKIFQLGKNIHQNGRGEYDKTISSSNWITYK